MALPGAISSVIDQLTFEASSTERWPKVLRLTDNIGIVQYTGNPGEVFDVLMVRTFGIDNDGYFTGGIDSLEAAQDASNEDSWILQVRGDWYMGIYCGAGNDGFATTFKIKKTGQIDNAVQDTLEFATVHMYNPRAIKLSEGYVAIISQGTVSIHDEDVWQTLQIHTLAVSAAGNISLVEWWAPELGSANASTLSNPWIESLQGTKRAIFFGTGAGTPGTFRTIDITDIGHITGAWIDTYATCNATNRPSIKKLAGDVVAICYGNGFTASYMTTLEIDSLGNITAVPIDTLDIVGGIRPTPITNIGGNIYAIMYEDAPTWDGFVYTFQMDNNGTIGDAVIDTEEFLPVSFHGARATIANFKPPVWVMAHDRANGCRLESVNIIPEFLDRIYVFLGTYDDPEKHELTIAANLGLRGILAAHTEIGWDEELQQASAGIAQIVADNHLGDYSPEKADGAFYGDLALGKYITIYEVYGGVRYDHFKGKIDKIVPHPEKDNQVCFILAVGGMDDMAQVEIKTVLRTDTETGELAGDVLDAVGWPAGDRDIDTGVDTLQLGWFHKKKGLAAMRELELTEHGRFYIGPTGKAVWENRHARLTGDSLVSQHDFEETMCEIAYEWAKRLVYNEVIVRGRRYFVGGATLWSGYDLATLDDALIYSAHAGDTGAPYIPQASSLTLWAEFQAPLESFEALVLDTHYSANTSPDGTGVDVGADITLSATQYGQCIKLKFTNGGTVGAYLTAPSSPPLGAPTDRTILVYGILYSEEVMTVTEEDAASQTAYGKRSLTIDSRFKSNPNDILSQAQFLKARYKDAVPRAVSVRLIARTAWPDDTIRIQCLDRHISDRITLKSALLGIDADYFINKVVQDYVIQEAGIVHTTEWFVERVSGGYEGVFWLLGVVGFSELGETTLLGF